MKKVSVIFFVLVIMTSMSMAQSKSSFGIFGGLNIPRLSGGNGNELSRDYLDNLKSIRRYAFIYP